jgi:CysZ protein
LADRVRFRYWRGDATVSFVTDVSVTVAPGVRKRPTRDFFTGVSFLLRGVGMYARSPGIMLLGLLPALISGVLLVGSFVALAYYIDDVATLITPYAGSWNATVAQLVRALISIAIVLAWVLLSVLFYTAITLLIGQPFYEAISKNVEDKLGGVPDEVNVSFWKTLPRNIVDSVRLIVLGVFVGALLFGLGLIPAFGQTVVPVLAVLFGGWILTLELTGVPFERRGLRIRDRRRMLRGRRSMALGFGGATFVCFLIPLGAVLLMPAAVAGATLLSRRLFGLPDAAGGR